MKNLLLVCVTAAISIFGGAEDLRSQELKRFMIGSEFDSGAIPVERAFSVYATYDPSAKFDDFLRNNPQLGSVTASSTMKANQSFFVPVRRCEIGGGNEMRREAEMSYTVISKEANPVGEVSGETLLDIYRHYSRRPNANFAEFQRCNIEIGATSPSDIISFAEKDLVLWSVALR